MKSPGKYYCSDLTLLQVADMFLDEEAAKRWIAEQSWADGSRCPRCGMKNVQRGIEHQAMTHRCRDCVGKPMFSVKTGTVMEGSQIKQRHWAVAIYLFTTNLKGVSSMRLHRELGIGK
ncbi:MAG: transposase [Albidovulum sp.]|nr:transposase [Albidovulum sp.]